MGGGQIVVKQSLPMLRVDADWAFDRRRILVERDCLRALEELLPGTAPSVIFDDPDRFVLGMSVAPPGGVVWKDAHMNGEIVPARATLAAELLVALQRASVGNRELERTFGDLMPLREGRIEPYHRAVVVRHPDLASVIEAEIARMLASRSVLVHGDFSPKNLIAYPSGMFMLDFEVAHWGDPAFDVAFMLSLLLTGSCLPGRAVIRTEAVRFWRSYQHGAGTLCPPDAAVVAELGCLLLARVDGKSPVEYLTDHAALGRVRAFARTLLGQRAGATVSEVLEDAVELRGEAR